MGLLDKIRFLFKGVEKSSYNPNLNEFQSTIGYYFRDVSLLELGLTHRSFSHSEDRCSSSNERLEFLGDSVLGLAVAEFLYRDHPGMREGELTKTKALLVNETTLTLIGKKIMLHDFIRLSPEEDRSGGRQRPSIISDAFESIIGAVYLDGGLDAVRDLVFRMIYTLKNEIISDKSQHNAKGELLELIQARGEGMPYYNVVSEKGPDHKKVFNVEVFVNGERYGSGIGHSKKEAEQKAAMDALKRVNLQKEA